jgi:hypothetical protein
LDTKITEIKTAGNLCVVNGSSTDVHRDLEMASTIKSGISTDTHTGTLNILTGKGSGKLTDYYYDEVGTYTVVPTQSKTQTRRFLTNLIAHRS